MSRSEAALAAGAPWFVAAAISAGFGWLRMLQVEQMGVLCGSVGSPHCSACYVAAAILALGVARSWQAGLAPSRATAV